MFRTYVFKRILYGFLMFVVMVFTYSALFNSITEQTMRAQIEEQIGQEMIRYRNLNEEQFTRLSEERRKQKYAQYHLDRPVFERILWRGTDALTFNFGRSTIIKAASGDREVLTIIGEVLPRTLLLFTTQIIIVVIIGVVLGLRCARKPNGLLDRMTTMLTMVTNGLPAWWLGLIMIMIFAYAIPVFPSGGLHSNPVPEGFAGFLDLLYHLSLPLVILVLLGVWGTAYLTRNIVLGHLQEDYVMAARARGIPEVRVLYGHTLRSSMPTILTIAVLSLFSSIAGNILVEGIFSWPGLGNLYFIAVQQNDVPVLMGALTIQTLVNMVGFILLDIAYGVLDPRIRVGGKA